MSDCGFDPARVQDFLDERLGERERHEVADHLADCEACRRLLASYTALDALLAHLPAEAPPALLVDQVMLAIDAEAEAEAPRRAPAELARTAAVVFAVLAGAAAFFTGGFAALRGDAAADPTAGVLTWLGALGESLYAGLAALFAGVGRVVEAWAALPASSLGQTAALLVVLGGLAAATNVLAVRATERAVAIPPRGRE